MKRFALAALAAGFLATPAAAQTAFPVTGSHIDPSRFDMVREFESAGATQLLPGIGRSDVVVCNKSDLAVTVVHETLVSPPRAIEIDAKACAPLYNVLALRTGDSPATWRGALYVRPASAG